MRRAIFLLFLFHLLVPCHHFWRSEGFNYLHSRLINCLIDHQSIDPLSLPPLTLAQLIYKILINHRTIILLLLFVSTLLVSTFRCTVLSIHKPWIVSIATPIPAKFLSMQMRYLRQHTPFLTMQQQNLIVLLVIAHM